MWMNVSQHADVAWETVTVSYFLHSQALVQSFVHQVPGCRNRSRVGTSIVWAADQRVWERVGQLVWCVDCRTICGHCRHFRRRTATAIASTQLEWSFHDTATRSAIDRFSLSVSAFWNKKKLNYRYCTVVKFLFIHVQVQVVKTLV